jgi:hypothetical protein
MEYKVSTQKKVLTILLRSWGEEVNHKTIPYVTGLSQKLAPFFNLRILLATNQGESSLKSQEFQSFIINKKVDVVYADLKSFSDPLNKLIQSVGPESPALILSLGVHIEPSQVIEALGWFTVGAWVYGWQIRNMENDGQVPGRAWYNTAALLHPDFISFLSQSKLPEWIDNGKEGMIKIGDKDIPIGGGEETVMMYMAIQANPFVSFILNTKEILEIEGRTGTDLSFHEKLLRKDKVAQHYLAKLNTSAHALGNHLLILKPDNSLLRGFIEESSV